MRLVELEVVAEVLEEAGFAVSGRSALAMALEGQFAEVAGVIVGAWQIAIGIAQWNGGRIPDVLRRDCRSCLRTSGSCVAALRRGREW
jgi:hypothetical protein